MTARPLPLPEQTEPEGIDAIGLDLSNIAEFWNRDEKAREQAKAFADADRRKWAEDTAKENNDADR
jgi:hypothetical protein